MTVAAIACASSARAVGSRAPSRRALAAPNALIGMTTATSGMARRYEATVRAPDTRPPGDGAPGTGDEAHAHAEPVHGAGRVPVGVGRPRAERRAVVEHEADRHGEADDRRRRGRPRPLAPQADEHHDVGDQEQEPDGQADRALTAFGLVLERRRRRRHHDVHDLGGEEQRRGQLQSGRDGRTCGERHVRILPVRWPVVTRVSVLVRADQGRSRRGRVVGDHRRPPRRPQRPHHPVGAPRRPGRGHRPRPPQRASTSPATTCTRDLRATSDIEEAVGAADVVVMGVPTHGFRDTLREVAKHIRPWVPVVSLSKGFELGTKLRMSQLCHEELPGHPVAVLTGPNLAKEILAGHAAAAVVATDDEFIATRAAGLLRHRRLPRLHQPRRVRLRDRRRVEERRRHRRRHGRRPRHRRQHPCRGDHPRAWPRSPGSAWRWAATR